MTPPEPGEKVRAARALMDRRARLRDVRVRSYTNAERVAMAEAEKRRQLEAKAVKRHEQAQRQMTLEQLQAHDDLILTQGAKYKALHPDSASADRVQRAAGMTSRAAMELLVTLKQRAKTTDKQGQKSRRRGKYGLVHQLYDIQRGYLMLVGYIIFTSSPQQLTERRTLPRTPPNTQYATPGHKRSYTTERDEPKKAADTRGLP